ncbi:MAG: hypothetical protein Q4G08_04935 [Capnocytophaga sp.]|nr:hypothetical protein [Capnocytophaga sp.]
MNERKTISFTSLNDIDTLMLEGNDRLALTTESFMLNDQLSAIHQPVLMEDIMIVFLREGELILRINLETHTVKARNAVVLMPDSVIEIESWRGSVHVDFLFFKMDAITGMQSFGQIMEHAEQILANPVLTLSEDAYKELNYLRNQLLKKNDPPQAFQSEINRYLLYVFCLKMLQIMYENPLHESEPKTESNDLKLYRAFFFTPYKTS